MRITTKRYTSLERDLFLETLFGPGSAKVAAEVVHTVARRWLRRYYTVSTDWRFHHPEKLGDPGYLIPELSRPLRLREIWDISRDVCFEMGPESAGIILTVRAYDTLISVADTVARKNDLLQSQRRLTNSFLQRPDADVIAVALAV